VACCLFVNVATAAPRYSLIALKRPGVLLQTFRPQITTVIAPIVVPFPAPAPDFKPVTKAELITILKKSIDVAERDRAIVILAGNALDSAPVRYFDGRLEAFRTILEFAELME
jgi:hypothetical protein